MDNDGIIHYYLTDTAGKECDVGCADFPYNASWVQLGSADRDDLFDITSMKELSCSLFGMISNDINMGPLGNFDPLDRLPKDKSTVLSLLNAAMEFRLVRPPDSFPQLQGAFDQAILNLNALVEGLTDCGTTANLVSYANKDSPALVFSQKIFQPHYGPKRVLFNDAEQYARLVSKELRRYLKPLHGKYKASSMRVVNFDGIMDHSVRIKNMNSTMAGSLVLVEFGLSYKHEVDAGLVAMPTTVRILRTTI